MFPFGGLLAAFHFDMTFAALSVLVKDFLQLSVADNVGGVLELQLVAESIYDSISSSS